MLFTVWILDSMCVCVPLVLNDGPDEQFFVIWIF